MANVNAPRGLWPVRHGTGGVIRLEEFTIASGLTADIFLGDVVRSTGTGKNIQRATNAADILGVFAGCQYIDANGDVQFAKQWKSGTATLGTQKATAWVYADPNIIFGAQIATIAEADVNLFADLVVGTGNALTGVSGDTVTITTGDQFRVIGLLPDAVAGALSEYGAYAKVELQCVRHERFAATLATAV